MARTGSTNAGGMAAAALVRNVLAGGRDLALYPFERRVPREWLALRLDRGLGETDPPSQWIAMLRRQPPALYRVLEGLRRAAADTEVRGVLVRVGAAPLGWSKVASLARALAEVREAGKTVVVYATHTGNAGCWLGSAADHFWLAPEGRVDLVGVRTTSPFVRELLDRLEIRPEVLSAGRYKSIGEQLTRRGMSEAAREALEAVVDDLFSGLVEGLAAGSAGSVDTARKWIDEGPYLAEEAHEIGLVCDLVYADELPARLAALADPDPEIDDREARLVGLGTYLRVSRERFTWTPLSTGPRLVAIAPLVGMLRASTASGRGLVGTLRRLGESDAVRAVVLRIDCPGGDALSSDLVWRAVRKLAEKKPVVASLGDVAASGGYYAAVAAGEVVAERTTLTGSIGVAMPWLEIDAFLGKLGVAVDAVERGRHAGIYDATRPRTSEERALLKRQLERLYAGFVGRVAEGRGLDAVEVERVAAGRVWTGAQAVERGLVDHLGGIGVAVERARELAGLAVDEGDVVAVPPSASPATQLRSSDPLDAFRGGALWCPIEIPLD